MQSNKNVRYFVSTTDKYRAEEPRYLWYCGTKKYRKGDGTGTVEKWYRGAAVVPWYRATLVRSFCTLYEYDCTTVLRCLDRSPAVFNSVLYWFAVVYGFQANPLRL